MAHVAVPAAKLRLDHVSIEVPDFADAVCSLTEELGLRVTVSPQAPERHGRIYLDRAYLEIAARVTDLSGPALFAGMDALAAARQVHVPVLFAYGTQDVALERLRGVWHEPAGAPVTVAPHNQQCEVLSGRCGSCHALGLVSRAGHAARAGR